MNKIKWFFMPKHKKLEYQIKIISKNKQRLHLCGFIFDFENMVIKKEIEPQERSEE